MINTDLYESSVGCCPFSRRGDCVSINPCHLVEEVSEKKVDLPSLANGKYTFLKGGYIAYLSKGEIHIRGNGLLILPKVVSTKLTLEAIDEMEVKGTFLSSCITTRGRVSLQGSFTGCLKDLERIEKPIHQKQSGRKQSILSTKRGERDINTPTTALGRIYQRLWQQ